MKRLIFGVLAATGLSSTALAADLPVFEPPPMEAVVATAYSWTGFYVGLNGGFAWGDEDVGLFDDDGAGFIGDVGRLEPDGGFGGAQIGVNYQWNWFVAGIEADIQGSGYFDDFEYELDGYSGRASSDVDWFGTVRGRAGVAWDRFLVYGTGGVAFGNKEYTVTVDDPRDGAIRDDEEVEVGWVAGGGVEYAWTDNLSTKAEYQFIDLGTNSASGDDFTTHPTVEFHTVRVGLNYKFNGLFQ